jgi:hypothetical protein
MIKLTAYERIKLYSKIAIAMIYNLKPGPLIVLKGKGLTYTVHKNLWVTISDGHSKDMLPLNFCSQEFVDNISKELEKRFIFRLLKMTPREQEYLGQQ